MPDERPPDVRPVEDIRNGTPRPDPAPSPSSNYWHTQNERRRRVRTQRQRGAGARAGTPVGQRSTRSTTPGRRRDPGPPPGRGRLEGTTHAVRRGPSMGQRIGRKLRPRRRRRPNIRRMMRGGPLTLTWGIITMALTTVLLVVQVGTWWAYSATSLGVTTFVGVIEARRGRATAPPAPRSPAKARSRPTGAGPGGAGGSPPKRKPPGRTGGRCSDACKRSPKPKKTCRCKAPDCQHGSLAGVIP